jgi:tRNA A-37 threonylcarbamoyl transferase component Bud32
MSSADLNLLTVRDLKNISGIAKVSTTGKRKKDIVDLLNKKFELDHKNKYKKIKSLGVKGKDGNVFEVENQGKKYALKQFRKNKPIEMLKKEAEMLKICSKHGISPAIFEVDVASRFIVMDLLGSSLFDTLNSTKGIMSLYQQEEFVLLILKLDKIGIYHGDPSPLNFLFDKDRLKVIDFGFSERIDKKFIDKHNTSTPNQKFMLLGFILKMKSLGVDVDSNYSYIKRHISTEDLRRCGIKS